MKKITIFLILITWPLSLLLANTFPNFLKYIIPIFEPKLILLPIIFSILYFHKNKRAVLILLLILILAFLWRPFFGQTIFIKDYEGGQKVLQQQKLYPSIFLARLFQNKARIPLDKFSNNFFALTDPNNYFFGFAPRQIVVNNQNLKKFPFLSLPFLLIGIFNINKIKHKKIILLFLLAGIINLSILTNFDRNDFILWLPISLIIIHGLNIFEKQFKYAKYFEFIFVIFASIEVLRILIMR